ncbi:hippurate hydrolase [Kytococcus aerolatus]|uniref:Hippurate hydrolase n=1 Tax=Kytococcus aerolatus TaxID=592308 RepID=A0A212U5G0_9MICO|nr:amidohydrolase [Kytococcus aerolatus]SNC73479.1 hippurate hydrolase [Kytococcus aerolatus]
MDALDALLQPLDELTGWQEELYRDLHAHPELSMQEERTAGIVAQTLEENGFTVHRLGGGVVGVLENGAGPRVLVRADMDGLPVREETGLEYASTATQVDREGVEQPVMHACGHDVHVAAGLAAARLVARGREHWSGTYVALFQPGEETAEGARAMLEDGLAEVVGPVDVALAQHVLTDPVAGEVMVSAGPVLSTAQSVEITVHGKGSHGSMPHLGVDPVVLASSIVLRLQTLVAREIAPGDFGVVTVGSVQAGGSANVIPDSARLLVNVRAYSEGVREQLVEGIERIVRAECAASGSPREPELVHSARYPLTENDPAATARVREAFVGRFGEAAVHDMPPQTASEDFSLVPRELGVPSVYWGFGGFTAGREPVANHNPGFAPDVQPTLRTGAEALVAAAGAWLVG